MGAFDDLIPPRTTGASPPAVAPIAGSSPFADLIPPRGYRLVPVAGNAYERYRAAAAPLLTRQGNDATELRQALLKMREQQAIATHGTEGIDYLVSALMAGLPQAPAQSAGAR